MLISLTYDVENIIGMLPSSYLTNLLRFSNPGIFKILLVFRLFLGDTFYIVGY